MKRILFSVAMVAMAQMLVFCQKQTYVEIETTYGNIDIQLYDATPGHRDNFLKLAEEGFYDGTLFHRVISEFMIQGGDPNSKGASPEARLGDGGPGYQLEAEIVYPKFFHKRGACRPPVRATRLIRRRNHPVPSFIWFRERFLPRRS
ncbi:peptidylprolyl isomerase [Geofilum rubicundum]|uniref:peptidylprolyl isomerase n=1 Tax=Geofilum rubicundum JCM 15548 TaxID=1236989 RepID=A0A0E9LUP1_9BACT|nr:peptidyl-prolyl cis-trans isomerase [Geofilum rubicundum JCM 15548]